MSAERKIQTVEGAVAEAPEPFALRQQIAERLAAHRSRRPQTTESEQPNSEGKPRSRNSRIAAAVAERYAHSQSYRDFLAEEAERTVREAEEAARQAEAAAAVAARNAEAVAQAQFNLLAELDQYAGGPHPAVSPRPSRQEGPRPVQQEDQSPELNFDVPVVPAAPPPPAFTVRLANDLHLPVSDGVKPVYRAHRAEEEGREDDIVLADPSEFLSLDEEIAFRQDPTFDPIEPTVEIPGNLIEFPRQLVAPRKARPRLAEGPLREEIESSSPLSQLRIFEVEAEQISQEPVVESSAPEWTSILLDAQPRGMESAAAEVAFYAPVTEPYAAQHLQYSAETQHLYTAPLAVAPLGLRLMSAIVDGCIILTAFAIFVAVAVLTATRLSPGPLHMPLANAAISSAGVIVLLGFFYQMLFFTFSNSTPGMRYARIGLCTFSDENPSRAAMRRRILSLALSSASLGLGVLWALLDEEHLGWHDRISRMYQRSY